MGPGPFAAFVSAGVLDDEAALLFNFMAQTDANSWMQDTANFVSEELGNGQLVGMVKARDNGKLKSKLPLRFHKTVTDNVAAVTGGGAIYFPLKDAVMGS